MRNKMKTKLEICCSSLEACIQAQCGGADRIELCGSMAAGGLTPSMGVFLEAKKRCNIPIAVMIRSRGTGFCYNDNDVIVMKKDAELFLQAGASAIVFGFLNVDCTIDEKRVIEFVELAHYYGKEAVFHRAIDDCANLIKEISVLKNLGVDRVLTAGGLGNALEQSNLLKEIVNKYSNDIQIIICGGIRSNNVVTLLKKTRADQIHSACRTMIKDRSKQVIGKLTYDNAYDCVDGNEVKRMVEQMKKSDW